MAGRPRDAARHDAILVAAQDLLAEVGYDRLTIEAVAARCGAGKNTIYRRWPDKPALVADAVADLHEINEDPDTGSVRDDLIAFAAEWHSADSRRDEVMAGMLTAMRHDAALRAAVTDAITTPRRAAFHGLVERAAERGEIASGRNVALIGSSLPAIVFHHVIVLNTPVDRDLVVSIIDDLILPALRG